MASAKTSAIILRLIPYRESSYIIYLFSKEYGIIHAVARGQRKIKGGQNFLERGFLIELVLYVRPNRDLHTATNIHVIDFFPDTRKDLIKSATRDTIFEAMLCFLTQADPHPDVFRFLGTTLEALESNSTNQVHPLILWHFFHKTSALLGFELDLTRCRECQKPLDVGTVRLDSSRGGLICTDCFPAPSPNQVLPVEALRMLKADNPLECDHRRVLSPAESKRTTFLLVDFCRLHFDISHKFKSLEFLNTMTDR